MSGRIECHQNLISSIIDRNTVSHIPTKLRQFLISSFSVFAWTDRHTDWRTDADKMISALHSHGPHTVKGPWHSIIAVTGAQETLLQPLSAQLSLKSVQLWLRPQLQQWLHDASCIQYFKTQHKPATELTKQRRRVDTFIISRRRHVSVELHQSSCYWCFWRLHIITLRNKTHTVWV